MERLRCGNIAGPCFLRHVGFQAGLEESERWIIESLRAGWQVASASFACKYLYDGLWPDAAAACLKQALDKFMTAHTHAHKDDLLVPQDH